MGKKLAIKGHPTRGKEIIELLEMMGGKNCYNLNGLFSDYAYYFIGGPSNDEICSVAYVFGNEDMYFFTLEEFLEKYPFKVGELTDFIDDHISCVITEMRWNERAECVEYHAEFGPNDYGWHREYEFYRTCQIEESDTVISGIYLNSCEYADEVELNLGDYEIVVRGGKTYAVKKKHKYPTTYEECVEIMGVGLWNTLWGEDATKYEKQTEVLVNALIKLKVCRDAYWKIAGKEMGLDKPWEHDLENEELYCIQNYNKQIIKSKTNTAFNKILIFPTKEMRDIFYENFKDLIESCKELL